jgi:sulfur-carrier protein
MIVVTLPAHLRALAQVTGSVTLQLDEPVTRRAILDALETEYPMLRGTIRDAVTGERRPFLRFFACGEDVSHEPADASVPADVAAGTQPFRIIGAMAGG